MQAQKKSATKPVYQTYLNEKQLTFLFAPQKTKVFVAGRSGGKSFTCGMINGIAAGGYTNSKGKYLEGMARAKVGLFGPSYQHLKNNVFPSLRNAFLRLGYIEYNGKNDETANFVCFKKPPAHWLTPWNKPYDYSNIITFANGYTIQLFSWHDAEMIRGVSLDGAHIDEAFLLDKETFDKVIFPAVRDNIYRYPDNQFHQQICFYSSMPWLASGMYLLEYEELARKFPEDIAFVRATSWDNAAVIGKKTLQRWEREMSPLEYKVEVMCEVVDRVGNCYYGDFDEKRNCYTSKAYEDVNPDMPLSLSFDFNAGFVCCLVSQVYPNEIRILDEILVKPKKEGQAVLLEDVVNEILKSYKNHGKKKAFLYGDSTGNNLALNQKHKHFENISQLLYEMGDFQSENKSMTYNPLYQSRHDVINKALRESDIKVPIIRINKRRCIYLPIVLSKTPINLDYSKDKSSEQDIHCPPERATHLSDNFDYKVYTICRSFVEERPVKSKINFLN